LGAGAVDADDQVARLQPGLCRRRAVDRRNDLGYTVFFGDLDAETTELAVNVGL
jgi:hypothetical protein